MAYLSLMLDDREVRKFALSKDGVVTIGRAQDNDIVINNLALSRRHAQIECIDGTFEVSDLGSQNGVYVERSRIDGSEALADNNTISLGTYKFAFHLEASDRKPERGPPAPRDASETQSLGSDDSQIGPFLVLTFNGVELQRFPLKGSLCQIGRAKECDVQIPERRLSRAHCEIECLSDGRYVVRDLGSQNGTFVNRRRIRGDHEIQNRDILNFAEYAVMFLADEAVYEGADADVGHEHEYDDDDAPAEPISAPISSEIASGETEMPPAYTDDFGYLDDRDRPVRPSDWEEEEEVKTPAPPVVLKRKIKRSQNAQPSKFPEAGEPIIERPRMVRKRHEQSGKSAPTDGKQQGRKSSAPPEELDEWYGQRNGSQLYSSLDDEELEDDSGDLVPRGASSVSQVLSTMMLDKRELARNLSRKKAVGAVDAKFAALVRYEDELIFSGPLEQAVTIMGTDRDADIRLKGRYVAGRHSLLVQVRDSLLLVRLGSSSAARVNGLPKLQAFLNPGDVIQIDDTTIEIEEA